MPFSFKVNKHIRAILDLQAANDFNRRVLYAIAPGNSDREMKFRATWRQQLAEGEPSFMAASERSGFGLTEEQLTAAMVRARLES